MTDRQPLDGAWELVLPGRPAVPAVVPGCLHTDLQRAGIIPDPLHGDHAEMLRYLDWADPIYRRTFLADEALLRHEAVDLVFAGLDTVATVKVNGQTVGQSESMFVPSRFPVRRALRPGEDNLLEVFFTSATAYAGRRRTRGWPHEVHDVAGGRTFIRKTQSSFGWDWAPRLPSAGIYRPVCLEGWDFHRIVGVHVDTDDRGRLRVKGRTARPLTAALRWRHRLLWQGSVVAEGETSELRIERPHLWWPHDLGEQPFYELQTELLRGDDVIDRWSGRVAFRRFELVRERDRWGESFGLRVNGVPFFAKGWNWVPAHIFPSEITGETYQGLLRDVRAAHGNTVRVWGGGLYEADAFYDRCDEEGLVVWQDLMFACAVYPTGDDYLRLYQAEIAAQAERLSRHPCIALWCGNNEGEWVLGSRRTRRLLRAHRRLFHELIPAAFAENVVYWPESPWAPLRPSTRGRGRGPQSGDAHEWGVWHGGLPASSYGKTRPRFVSEFGMGSYPSPETAARAAPDFESFGPAFKLHHNDPGGDLKLARYLAARYPRPSGYAETAYLSQVNQADALETAVRHWRALAPRCLGSLIWQLNDCWPAVSWSTVEFGGAWKLAHHAARRFFAPVTLAVEPGGLAGRTDPFNVTVISDRPEPFSGKLQSCLFQVSTGQRLFSGEVAVRAIRLQPEKILHLDSSWFARAHGADDLAWRFSLWENESNVSELSYYLASPVRVRWSPAPVTWRGGPLAAGRWEITLESSAPQHAVALRLPGVSARFSDNGFDLWPDRPRTVVVELPAESADSTDLSHRLEVFTMARLATRG